MKSGSRRRRACNRKRKARTRRSGSHRHGRILLFSSSPARVLQLDARYFCWSPSGRRAISLPRASCPHKTLVRKRFSHTHTHTHARMHAACIYIHHVIIFPFKFSSALFNEARIARRPHLRNFAAYILPNHHRARLHHCPNARAYYTLRLIIWIPS